MCSGGSDGSIQVWGAAPPFAPLAVLHGHSGTVYALTLHSGLLFSACADGTIRVWDASSRKALAKSIAPGSPSQPLPPQLPPLLSLDVVVAMAAGTGGERGGGSEGELNVLVLAGANDGSLCIFRCVAQRLSDYRAGPAVAGEDDRRGEAPSEASSRPAEVAAMSVTLALASRCLLAQSGALFTLRVCLTGATRATVGAAGGYGRPTIFATGSATGALRLWRLSSQELAVAAEATLAAGAADGDGASHREKIGREGGDAHVTEDGHGAGGGREGVRGGAAPTGGGEGSGDGVYAMTQPDAALLATGHASRVIRLWSLPARACLRTIRDAHNSYVTALSVAIVGGAPVLLSGSSDSTWKVR